MVYLSNHLQNNISSFASHSSSFYSEWHNGEFIVKKEKCDMGEGLLKNVMDGLLLVTFFLSGTTIFCASIETNIKKVEFK